MTRKKRSGVAALVELLITVAVAVGLALLIQAFLFKPYKIPSPSMVPTLAVGQRVIVNRLVYHFHSPHRYDIIVFHPPAGSENPNPLLQCGVRHSFNSVCPEGTDTASDQNFIKRIVGLPGDTLSIRDGKAVINGTQLKESYAEPCGSDPICNKPKPIRIPAGQYFMMGDNRGESDDSRSWGPVPRKWIVGKAFFTYWPPNRIGTI